MRNETGWLPLFALWTACATPPAGEEPGDIYALVLGTAQDGGLPQVGCEDEICRGAWEDPGRRRLVSSLLLVDGRSGGRWLFDASPDLVVQVELARGRPSNRSPAGHRPPLFEGIFLTHAHMGHYTGLLHLGNEAYGAQDVPLYVSPRMAGFLRSHSPWDRMVAAGAFELRTLAAGRAVRLGEGLSVTPLAVPHREELSDTLAFVIRGPERALLYLPDIDKWERWDRRIEDLLAEVDVALLDGTFFAAGEVPGRDMSRIPHPFVVESLERFRSLPPAERAKVFFTHLNHTNPASVAESPEAERVRREGMSIAREGQTFGL